MLYLFYKKACLLVLPMSQRSVSDPNIQASIPGKYYFSYLQALLLEGNEWVKKPYTSKDFEGGLKCL